MKSVRENAQRIYEVIAPRGVAADLAGGRRVEAWVALVCVVGFGVIFVYSAIFMGQNAVHFAAYGVEGPDFWVDFVNSGPTFLILPFLWVITVLSSVGALIFSALAAVIIFSGELLTSDEPSADH